MFINAKTLIFYCLWECGWNYFQQLVLFSFVQSACVILFQR